MQLAFARHCGGAGCPVHFNATIRCKRGDVDGVGERPAAAIVTNDAPNKIFGQVKAAGGYMAVDADVLCFNVFISGNAEQFLPGGNCDCTGQDINRDKFCHGSSLS